MLSTLATSWSKKSRWFITPNSAEFVKTSRHTDVAFFSITFLEMSHNLIVIHSSSNPLNLISGVYPPINIYKHLLKKRLFDVTQLL